MYEANYARYLQLLKEKNHIFSWEHEPKTFWFEGIKCGCVSYKPDFKVTYMEGFHYWVEVKGYMDSKSQTKIKRFQKYFPNETLFVIDKKWFKKNSNIMYGIIKDWEKKEPKWTNIQEKLKLE